MTLPFLKAHKVTGFLKCCWANWAFVILKVKHFCLSDWLLHNVLSIFRKFSFSSFFHRFTSWSSYSLAPKTFSSLRRFNEIPKILERSHEEKGEFNRQNFWWSMDAWWHLELYIFNWARFWRFCAWDLGQGGPFSCLTGILYLPWVYSW